MSYIPDITERYPDGFGMPERGMDMWAADEFDNIPIPYENETEEPISTQFKVGQHYRWTSWFTGGVSHMVVIDIKDGNVVFEEERWEIDGQYNHKESFPICKDGDKEYVVMCHYRDEEGRLYAE